jgi:phosphinothricin acetyltransferase
MVRTVESSDAEAIAAIYNHYVMHTVVTFEEDPVTGLEMARRIEEVLAASLPWIVAEDSDRVVIGYAYATRWKARAAYRHSVETTVYLADNRGRQGLGTQLYTELFRRLKQCGIHAAIGGIALPNAASVALHEKFGMRKVAHFDEVGFKFGKWVDVGYWEVTFN